MTDNLKKYKAIVGARMEYEESGATVTTMSALNGAGLFIFGVPTKAQGGPVKGQLIEVAVIETVDADKNVTRQYAGFQPVAGGLDFAKIKDGTAEPVVRPAFDKANYKRKKSFASKADDLAPAAESAIA